MDEIELTKLFVEYAQTRSKLAELEEIIKEEVLTRRDTIKIAGVTATYYKESAGTPRYEEAVIHYLGEHPEKQQFLEQFQTTTVATAWKDACIYFEIPAQPGDSKPARVVVK